MHGRKLQAISNRERNRVSERGFDAKSVLSEDGLARIRETEAHAPSARRSCDPTPRHRKAKDGPPALCGGRALRDAKAKPTAESSTPSAASPQRGRNTLAPVVRLGLAERPRASARFSGRKND